MGAENVAEKQQILPKQHPCPISNRDHTLTQSILDEYLVFGYIRVHYDKKQAKQHAHIHSTLKNIIYQIFQEFEIILLHQYGVPGKWRLNAVFSQQKPKLIKDEINHCSNDSWQCIHNDDLVWNGVTESLEIQCRGDLAFTKLGWIELNGNQYCLQRIHYTHLKVNVDGNLHLYFQASLITYMQENGGSINIECDYLHMNEYSRIMACGFEFGGQINIHIRKQLIVNEKCYIKSDGHKTGGQIRIFVGECIKGDGLVIDVSECTDSRGVIEKPICEGGIVDLNFNKLDTDNKHRIVIYGSNNGEMRCNHKLQKGNKVTIKNGVCYWKLRQ